MHTHVGTYAGEHTQREEVRGRKYIKMLRTVVLFVRVGGLF